MKRCLIVLVTMGVMLIARADYLSWQISSTDNETYGKQYATLSASKDGTSYVNLMTIATGSEIYQVSVDGYMGSAASFLVEVFNYSNGTKYETTINPAQSYSDLASKGAIITETGLTYTEASVWHGGTSYSYLSMVSAPEPTSALLLLIGTALLNLKRRRA